MDKMRAPMAKILVRGDGLGVPNAELVRKRAEELASINGRTQFNEIDWQRARIELHGAHGPDGQMSDEFSATAMVSEADMVTVDVGHHTERLKMEDDRNLVEELWVEGMEEAEHDRMLASRAEQEPEED